MVDIGKNLYFSLHEDVYIDGSTKGTYSCVFTTRPNGFILFTVTCQQQYKENRSCFSIAKNVSWNAPLRCCVCTLAVLFTVQKNGVCVLWVQA